MNIKMMKRLIGITIAGAMLLASCERIGGGQHLIKSKEQREAIAAQAAERESLANPSGGGITHMVAHGASSAELEAVQFLYAYMPLCDLGGFPLSYVLQQAQVALEARSFFRWGKKVPNNLFLHYVLPFRVSNELPDDARMALYGDLRDIVAQRSSMSDAVLEVALWCREQAGPVGATCQRVSGPLSIMRAAQGHQREMTVLLVSALRAVCIPARAVDGGGEAWAEAWADGQWYAIDPSGPAVAIGPVDEHLAAAAWTIVPGAYAGPEAQLARGPYHTKLNLLPQHKGSRLLNIKVLEASGKAVPNAHVELQRLCDAELCPVACGTTDAQGEVVLPVGSRGDLLLWASYFQQYGLLKVGAHHQGDILLRLGSAASLPQGNIDLAPAVGPLPSPTEIRQRAQQADALRAQRVDAFIDSTTAAALAHDKGVNPLSVCRALRLSRGNWEEVRQFISTLDGKDLTVGMALLDGLDERDLQSTSAALLRSHLAVVDVFPPLVMAEQYSMFDRYVLAPRIGQEPLEGWRSSIQQHFSYDEAGFFRNNPEHVAHWLREHVRIDNQANYAGMPMSPMSILRLGVADEPSRDILFVAICRSFGIPARLSPINQAPQYLNRKGWHTVFALSAPGEHGRMKLPAPANAVIARPCQHYTLARLDGEGQFVSMPIPPLPAQLDVEPGLYRVVTRTPQRNACGLFFVEVSQGEAIDMPMTFY